MTISCGDLLIGNSMAVDLIGLSSEGTAITDATCVCEVRNSAGDLVSGDDPIPMVYDSDLALYRGVLPADMSLTADARYTITATATKAGIGQGQWTTTRVAKYRDASCCE